MYVDSWTMYKKPIEKVGQCTLIRTCSFSISAPSTHDLGQFCLGDEIRTGLTMGTILKFNILYNRFDCLFSWFKI